MLHIYSSYHVTRKAGHERSELAKQNGLLTKPWPFAQNQKKTLTRAMQWRTDIFINFATLKL